MRLKIFYQYGTCLKLEKVYNSIQGLGSWKKLFFKEQFHHSVIIEGDIDKMFLLQKELCQNRNLYFYQREFMKEYVDYMVC